MRKSFSEFQSAPESFLADDANQPEAPLWNWLRAHDIPYHQSERVLEHAYGVTRPYPGSASEVHLPAGPLGEIRSTPWCLPALSRENPALSTLYAEVYGPDWAENFNRASAALTEIFGPAHQLIRNNAKSAYWRFGRAELSCMVWPPEENTHPNARHEALPETIGAARIGISPAWRPPVNAALQDMVAGFNCLYRPDPDETPFLHSTAPFECRPWSAQPPAGLWATEDSPVILLSYPDRPVILPFSRLDAITLDILRPAKGGGLLALGLATSSRTYPLTKPDYHADRIPPLRQEAKALANALDLPFREHEDWDA